MNDEQIRKDFEDWMGDDGLSPRAIERNSKGDYRLMQAAHAFEVWKAAHTHYAKSAAPVDMPEPVMAQVRFKPENDTAWSRWKVCAVGDARGIEAYTLVNGWGYEVRYLHAEQQVQALLAAGEQAQADKEMQLAMQEASSLAQSIFALHYREDEDYASGRVVWGLCDSLRGVISQIDNMTTGLVRAPQPQVEEQEALEDMLAGVSAPAAQAINLLAADHSGMKVDYRGLFSQVQRAIKRSDPGYAEMLRQLEGHLQELGQRWYAGDTNVVDEILQLYCIERDSRKTVRQDAAAAPQPQADALDAERYRWLRDYWLGNEPEAINMERAKGQRGLDAAIDAAIAAAKENK